MADKSLHDEVTELTEAVRELRDRELAETVRELRAEVEKLRAERAGHCGCTCTHIHWGYTHIYPNPGTVTYPVYGYQVTSGTNTLTSSATGSGLSAGSAGYTVSATN